MIAVAHVVLMFSHRYRGFPRMGGPLWAARVMHEANRFVVAPDGVLVCERLHLHTATAQIHVHVRSRVYSTGNRLQKNAVLRC
jgi:hypothetical protein